MNLFRCPICKNDLQDKGKFLKCINNHTYDKAKEGYVNLLPINSKKSKDPGDNLQMITARRNFLESGYYSPLAERLAKILKQVVNKECNFLDIGCGEGYYTNKLFDLLDLNKNIFGIDISKNAIKYASKRNSKINYAVASAYDLPFKEDSMDIILRIYAPSLTSEIERILKKTGILITVTPGDRHLYQLREIIYNQVKNLSNKSDETETFNKINSYNLKYNIELLKSSDINNLIQMTPFGWKIKEIDLKELLNKQTWIIEADFNIDLYKKV